MVTITVALDGTVTVTRDEETPPVDPTLEQRVVALEAGAVETEQRFVESQAAFDQLVSGAEDAVSALWARHEFVPWRYQFIGTGEAMRINETSPAVPATAEVPEPPALGVIPVDLGRALLVIAGDPNSPGSLPFVTGYNFLDLPATVAGVLYTVDAIEPIASAPSPVPPADPTPPAEDPTPPVDDPPPAEPPPEG